MKLRRIRKSDVPVLAEWLPAVSSQIGCDRWAAPDTIRDAVGQDGIFAIDEGGPLGVLSLELDAPEKASASIRMLAVEPARRRLGFGGRAALALERRLRKSVRRIYVLVPARIGLALYFWLRLGYQPLTHEQFAPPPQSGPALWMVRNLN